jgi:hypothetical protein
MTPGKNSKWKLEYNEKIVKFFDRPFTKLVNKMNKNGEVVEVEVANDFPTFQRFAHEIGVDVDTLHEWKKDENREKYPNFSESYKKAKEIQEDFWVANGMNNNHSTAFAIFWAKNNLGYKDKTEVDQTVRQAPKLEVDLND